MSTSIYSVIIGASFHLHRNNGAKPQDKKRSCLAHGRNEGKLHTSGPLKTLGSFISFHVYRSTVLPSYWSGAKREAHHARTPASVKSK